MLDKNLLTAAMQVRKAMLNMLITGVTSSDHGVGIAEDCAPENLAKVLEYSPATKEHGLKIRQIWGPMVNDPVVSEDANDLFSIGTNDIVYSPEMGQNYSFYLAKKHTTRPLADASASIAANITLDNKLLLGLWKTTYSYWEEAPLGDPRVPVPAFPREIYPEQQMLLQFYFAPDELADWEVESILPVKENMRRHTSFVSEYLYKKFRHFKFKLDGVGLGKLYLELGNILFTQDGHTLQDRGTVCFEIVQLGTTEIAGQKYWVYSGSERLETMKNR